MFNFFHNNNKYLPVYKHVKWSSESNYELDRPLQISKRFIREQEQFCIKFYSGNVNLCKFLHGLSMLSVPVISVLFLILMLVNMETVDRLSCNKYET